MFPSLQVSATLWRFSLLLLPVLLLTGLIVECRLTIDRLASDIAAADQGQKDLRLAEQYLSTLKDAETGQRGYLLTGKESYLEPYLASVRDQTQLNCRFAAEFDQDKQTRVLLHNIDALAQQKMSELAATIQLKRQGNSEVAIALVNSGTGKQLMEEIRQQVSRLETYQQALLDRQLAARRVNQIASERLVVIGGTSVIALLALCAFFSHRDSRRLATANSNLTTAAEQLRLAVESGNVGVWFLEINNNSYHWSPRCQELHGSDSAQMLSYFDYLMLVHPQDRPFVQQTINTIVNDGRDLSMEYRTRHLNGNVRWIYAQGRARMNSTGEVIGAQGTVVDLSERKAMEARLRRANAELEQFAWVAAHDLQEPCRNVALLAALMLDSSQTGGEISSLFSSTDELLSEIAANSRRSVEQIKGLGEYVRALSWVEEGSAGPLADGTPVLAKVLRILSSTITKTKATVTFDTLPAVPMTETHLLQVLRNLIENALKYSGPNPPVVHIGGTNRQEDTAIYVRDEGIGIDPNLHSRVFGLFKRLHTRDASGSGIGLTLCKRIVEHYGGTIWIESEAGKGARFSFAVPVHGVQRVRAAKVS